MTPPVESSEAREAILAGYRALVELRDSGVLEWLEAEGDPAPRETVQEGIAEMEARMSPNLLVTVLPSYTKVRFATDRNRPGETQEGILRDGAWGLIPGRLILGRTDANQRRITTNGWELFVDETTAFTHFEIIERG